MDLLTCEIRFEHDGSRESPGSLAGVLMRYETPARDRPELFKRGSLSWPPAGILIREMHQRHRPIVRAVPYLEGDEVRINAPLPNTAIGRDAAENVRQKVYTGLSVEFNAIQEARRGGLREIVKAVLGGAGLVDSGAYADAVVEVRAEDAGLWIPPGVSTLWL